MKLLPSFYKQVLALGLPTSLLQSLSKAEVRTRAGPVVPGTLNPLGL